MKSPSGIACWGTALVLVGAGLICQAVLAATPAPQDQDTARIAEIMHRLRDVRRFDAVSVAPNGRIVAWTVTEKAPAESGGKETAAGVGKKPAQGAKAGSAANGGKPGQVLQTANADGTNVRTVTIAKAAKSCRYSNLNWSPDGKTLAFLSNCNHGASSDEQFDIYEVSASDAEARRVSHLHGLVSQLAWTPNGSELSFLYVKGDVHPVSAVSATKALIGVIGETGVERQGVAVLPASGGEVRQITPGSIFIYEYDWSPTGNGLAYIGAPPPGRDNWWTAKLYTQTLEGAPVVALDPSSVAGPLHGLQIALPRWSPDGSRIALIGGLMSDQGATAGDVYVLRADGGEPVDVTPDITISPSWLTWTGNHALLVSSIAGGSTQLSVFALHGTRPATQRPLLAEPAGLRDGTFASAVSVSARHDVLAFIGSTFDSPPEIFAGSLRANAAAEPVGVLGQPQHSVGGACSWLR